MSGTTFDYTGSIGVYTMSATGLYTVTGIDASGGYLGPLRSRCIAVALHSDSSEDETVGQA